MNSTQQNDDIAIKVTNLSKCYHVYDKSHDRLKQFILPRLQRTIGVSPKQYFREFWALNDVSFEIKKGETFGIIGRNGSGKSTLLQMICGTLNPTGGSIQTNGRIGALLELGAGFNGDFTGRENIYLNGSILGLTGEEVNRHLDDIIAFADIGEFIDQPVKTYSSGMFVRLAFAVQAHVDASIIIIDEALAVGDVFFRQKCYARLEQLKDSGAAIVLVSHGMAEIEQFCKRAILLDHGTQRFIGSSSEAAKHYYLLHQPVQEQVQAIKKPVTELTVDETLVHTDSSTERPPPEAFIDISNKSQISNGQARCIGVALCNAAGEPCNSFRQGDLAVFYYEFELAENIGVPICGIVIKNERNVIVHGKNSWQFENDVPVSLGAGSKVLCRQEIKLDIAQGEYLFEIGLASISSNTWLHREQISHEEMSAERTRICHVADIGSFSVGLAVKNGVSMLTHHGIANLFGNISVTIEYPPEIKTTLVQT